LRHTVFIFCPAGSESTSFISCAGCLDDEIVLKNGSWREEPLSGRVSSEMFDIVHIVLEQMERRPSIQVQASKRHSLLFVL